jgi:dTDP-4-amino-4,6-dideoxy-D-galactose acyltransferase
MASTMPSHSPGNLAPLEWESAHFGHPVAQIGPAQLSDSELADALSAARRAGVARVVCSAPVGREISSDLLTRYGGMLADRKVTFTRPLDASQQQPAAACEAIEYRNAVPSADLVELALASGIYSRFRIDPRIPAERFEAMYRIWIARSVAGELADAVLVVPLDNRARQSLASQRLAGMITISLRPREASIGLVAVAETARGRGVGQALLRAAHAWMRSHGAPRASVVTQLTNEPACRLYQRAGYEAETVQHVYHFWP